MGVIVDTCIWIDVERGTVSPADVASHTGSEPVFLSPVSITELSYGAEKAENPSIRQKRHAARLLTRDRRDFEDIPGLDLIVFAERAERA